MPKPTKRFTQVIRKWDTFVVTQTLNGFLVSADENPTLSSSVVAKEIGEVQDLFEAWANEKAKRCINDDDGED